MSEVERADIVDEAFLKMSGAGGSYDPIRDRVIISDANEAMSIPARKAVDEDGWNGGQNAIAHELEHRRQFNYPGDYSSAEAKRIAKGIDEKFGGSVSKAGYSDANLPLEVPAFLKGSNASEGSKGLRQASSHHPVNGKLSDEEKLWLLKNENKWQTDQDFLENIDRFGIKNANRIERVKHIGRDIASRAEDAFSKAWGYMTK